MAFGALPFLSGCGTLHYLLQAGEGQLAMFNRARPISQVLKDPHTSDRVKALLKEIPAVKSFGEQNGLKPTRSYTEYVKLNRPVATWVVSACKPLEFKSKEWSFPIAGTFPYLGWFNLDDAKKYADELTKEGWDADVRGASAYSTLGWFRDPVLSSMIASGDDALGYLVNTILHESVHATIYFNGQAYFNESLAMFVADLLTRAYLQKTRGADAPETAAYAKAQEDYAEREEKFHVAYEKLATLYASNEPDSEKLEEKAKILADLKVAAGLKKNVNNATLVQFKTYHVGVAEFTRLLNACEGSVARFMATLKNLTSKSFDKPEEEDLAPAIDPLTQKGCPLPPS